MDNRDVILTAVNNENPADTVNYVLDIIFERAVNELNNRISACTRCSICNAAKGIVDCRSAKPGSILVLSEHVTRDQLENSSKGDSTFYPYSHSMAEDRLKELLQERFKEGSLLFSDTVHCYPYRNNWAERPPSTKEISACLHFTWELIRFAHPIAIMIMGNIALNALLPGQYIADRDHGKWIMIRDTPAMIFQKPSDIIDTVQEGFFIKDLDLFVNSLRSNERTKILLRERND